MQASSLQLLRVSIFADAANDTKSVYRRCSASIAGSNSFFRGGFTADETRAREEGDEAALAKATSQMKHEVGVKRRSECKQSEQGQR